MKLTNESSKSAGVKSPSQSGPKDPTLQFLKSRGLPATIENYLALAFPGEDLELDDLDAEVRAGLPPELLDSQAVPE